jgi:hypothetical protein
MDGEKVDVGVLVGMIFRGWLKARLSAICGADEDAAIGSCPAFSILKRGGR